MRLRLLRQLQVVLVIPEAWSWLLTSVGVIGLFLAGQKRSVGWAVGLAAQVLWVIYGVTTKQYGFIASALIYGATYARNYFVWREAERVEG